MVSKNIEGGGECNVWTNFLFEISGIEIVIKFGNFAWKNFASTSHLVFNTSDSFENKIVNKLYILKKCENE